MPHASRSRLESPRLLAVVPLRSICVSRLEPSCLLAVASRKQLELEGPLTEFGEVVIGLGRMAASHAHPLYAGSTKRFGACVPETTTRPDRRWSSPCSSNRGTVLPCSCLLSHGDARSALVNIFECAERAHARSARPGGCSTQPTRYVGSSSQGTSRAIEIRMAGLLLTTWSHPESFAALMRIFLGICWAATLRPPPTSRCGPCKMIISSGASRFDHTRKQPEVPKMRRLRLG
jgi:hypothetical protein